MSWQIEVAKASRKDDADAVIISQQVMPAGVNAHPPTLAPQMIAIFPDDIDSFIERLELLKSELQLKHDRGQFVLIWPEALRELQLVLDDDEQMTNDAQHDLLVEIAEACGLQSPEYCGVCGMTHTGEPCYDEDDEYEEHEELGIAEA